VIAPWHGQRLFDASRDPKRLLWVEGAGHNDLVEVAGAKYWDALASFARLVEHHPAPPPDHP
jgi:abhydrolase domain-containing protein 17